jgi:hypothetical protein
MQARLASNSKFSCLCFISAKDYRHYNHALLTVLYSLSTVNSLKACIPFFIYIKGSTKILIIKKKKNVLCI